ncbi:heme ABC transporter ATP-binding protein [Homoserinibacter sp. YIM 151385]|uniref:heme ABC transporter ATP-binding protein n=1 Tax=Homoserinibacter sp. YIM 151385 TaxID=2985506 RepID=UPI0022F07E85|nr:heme ABC transporter ATP-binding protein [Homoserinibacter sp. YIM 151385]WBU37059.1 heme ABC transporter ATP-binding protein [Homoserinibacter sp. YIM 151385]
MSAAEPVEPVATAHAASGIQARGIVVRRGGRVVLDGADLVLRPGELLAVVGPNGSGKSTLLEVLAGDRAPEAGEVLLDGMPLAGVAVPERARRRAVMTQHQRVAFAFRVREVVALARAPWRGRPESAGDERAVAEGLARADAEHLAERAVTELSGGEGARVALARALAQESPTILLDEPTASLDLAHQEAVLGVLRAAARAGSAVLVVLHDLDAAAAYADRIAILSGGRIVADGPPAEALDETLLERVYGWPVRVAPEPSGRLGVRPVRA